MITVKQKRIGLEKDWFGRTYKRKAVARENNVEGWVGLSGQE
jgi:hypothetical protein